MENLVLVSFAVYSISPSDQAKNIAVSLSRHFPTPYSTRLQLYMKIHCSCYYQWDLEIHLSAVTFTLKLLAQKKFIRSQSVTIQTDDLTSPEVVYIEN